MKNIFLFLLILLMPVSLSAADIYAEAEAKKLNKNVTMTKTVFDGGTALTEETPLSDPDLSFRIKLPKGWKKLTSQTGDEKNITQQVLSEISQYIGPPALDLRSSFRVQAAELPFEVTAKDWFLNHILTSNYSLEGIEIRSDRRVQAQYVMLNSGRQYVVRAVAEISGPKIILAEYIVPIEFWEEEKNFAIWSMASFYLLSPNSSPVEKRIPHSIVDIAQFQYPASWILSAPPLSSLDRIDVSLINLKGGIPEEKRSRNYNNILLLDGRIEMTSVAKATGATLSSEVVSLKSDLAGKDLILGDFVHAVEGWKFDPFLTLGKIEVYKVNNQKNTLADYETWIGVFESKDRIFIAHLLTVGRQNNFLTWARNIAAFKAVTTTLSPARN